MPDTLMTTALSELADALSILETAKARTIETRTALSQAEEAERAAHVVASAARRRIAHLEAEPMKAASFDREVAGLREAMSLYTYPLDHMSPTRGRVRRELDALVSDNEASYAERLERLRRLHGDFVNRYRIDQDSWA